MEDIHCINFKFDDLDSTDKYKGKKIFHRKERSLNSLQSSLAIRHLSFFSFFNQN